MVYSYDIKNKTTKFKATNIFVIFYGKDNKERS